MVSLEIYGQEKYWMNHRSKPTYLTADQSPPVGTNGDSVAKRILSLVLIISDKTIVTFSMATTKYLPQFLSPSPGPEPPPPTSPFTPRSAPSRPGASSGAPRSPTVPESSGGGTSRVFPLAAHYVRTREATTRNVTGMDA